MNTVEPTHSISLMEAVGNYLGAPVGSSKGDDSLDEAQRELFRFVHWYGPERALSELSPSQIEEYAGQTGGSGAVPQAVVRLQILKGFLSYAKKKGLIVTNLAQHVKLRTPNPRAQKGRLRADPEVIELTQHGHAQLLAQLERLKAERVPLAQQIHKAAADKDVRENVPLEAAREQLGHVESRIRSIEETLKAAIIGSASRAGTGAVKVGARVSVRDLGSGRETIYTLVSSAEANPSEGRISDLSPLGKALLNRTAGQEVEVETPRGRSRYRVLEVAP